MDTGRGPSTYEVEGPLSSAVRGSPITRPASSSPTSQPALSSPITQPASTARSADPRQRSNLSARRFPRNTPTSIPASLGEHRSTRCLPPQEGAYPRGRLASWSTTRELHNQPPAHANVQRFCPPTLGFPPGSGHHLWWRARFLPPPPPPRKRLTTAISGIFTHPQDRPRYPQADTGYPPVVHRLIHTQRPRRARQ